MTTNGTIPQSPLLASASPESLALLLSRDPEGYSDQDLDKVVEAFRADRRRWEEAEAGGKPKAKRIASTAAVVSSSEDLGF